jgi:hypothetical protein
MLTAQLLLLAQSKEPLDSRTISPCLEEAASEQSKENKKEHNLKSNSALKKNECIIS